MNQHEAVVVQGDDLKNGQTKQVEVKRYGGAVGTR